MKIKVVPINKKDKIKAKQVERFLNWVFKQNKVQSKIDKMVEDYFFGRD